MQAYDQWRSSERRIDWRCWIDWNRWILVEAGRAGSSRVASSDRRLGDPPLALTSDESLGHLDTWTLAYTHSSSLGGGLDWGFVEILTWPYSTSCSTVVFTTRLHFIIWTLAYVNSCPSSTCAEPEFCWGGGGGRAGVGGCQVFNRLAGVWLFLERKVFLPSPLSLSRFLHRQASNRAAKRRNSSAETTATIGITCSTDNKTHFPFKWRLCSRAKTAEWKISL